MTTAAVPEVAPESVTGTVSVIGDYHPRVRDMVRSIAAEVSENSSDDFVLGLMEQILQADTFEDIFASQEEGMVSGQDFAMRPFLLHGNDIQWMKSRHQRFPFYAIMKVTTIDTGEEVTLNCGGMTFVAVLRALEVKGYFPDDEPRPLVIRATESPEGAYLSLIPFKGAVKPAATKNAKK